jgi:hypothetical protein
MTKLFSLLISTIFFPFTVFSQTHSLEKRLSDDVSPSFKKVTEPSNKSAPIATQYQSQETIIQKNEINTKEYNFLYDFNSMSTDVKEKIAFNKYNNFPLTEGIQKTYVLKIINLKDSLERKNLIIVFKKLRGFLKAEFLNNEVIKIFLEPNISSTYVKDFLESNKVSAEFINEQYIIYNKN